MFIACFTILCLLVCAVLSAEVPNTKAEETQAKISKLNEEVSMMSSSAAQVISAMHSRSTADIRTAMGRISAVKAKFGYSGNRNMDHIDISTNFGQTSPAENGKASQNSNQSKSRLEATLDHHNVGDQLIAEINKMAESFIPKEDIIDHVRKHHFPNKHLSDLNDIVVSAIAVAGKPVGETMTLQQSKLLDRQNHHKKYEKLKKDFERQFAS